MQFEGMPYPPVAPPYKGGELNCSLRSPETHSPEMQMKNKKRSTTNHSVLPALAR